MKKFMSLFLAMILAISATMPVLAAPLSMTVRLAVNPNGTGYTPFGESALAKYLAHQTTDVVLSNGSTTQAPDIKLPYDVCLFDGSSSGPEAKLQVYPLISVTHFTIGSDLDKFGDNYGLDNQFVFNKSFDASFTSPTPVVYHFVGESGTATGFSASLTVNYIPVCEIKFDPDNGELVKAEWVEYGSTITQPATDPTKAGSIFAGWVSDDINETPFDGTASQTEHMTFKAKWLKEVKIFHGLLADKNEYEAANGSIKTVPAQFIGVIPDDLLTMNEGDNEAIDFPVPYNIQVNGGIPSIANIYTVGNLGSITLSVDADGTPLTSLEMMGGVDRSLDFASGNPEIKYTFSHNDTLDPSNNVEVTTLTVTYIPMCEITFDPANSSDPVKVEWVKVGESLTAPMSPILADHAFGGWYSEDGNDTEYDPSDPQTEHMNFKAKWIPNTVDVTWHVNGAETVESIVPGDKVTEPAEPTLANHKFIGWYVDAAFTALFDFDTAINADTDIYAQIIELKDIRISHTVSTTDTKYVPANETIAVAVPISYFDNEFVQGGTYKENIYLPYNVDAPVQLMVFGKVVDLTAVPPMGEASLFLSKTLPNTFATGTPEQITYEFEPFIKEGTTIKGPKTTVEVTYIPQCEIKYIANGGIFSDSVGVVTNSANEEMKVSWIDYGTIFSSSDPVVTKSGFDFDGWYADEALTTPFVLSNVAQETHMNIYAKWTPTPPVVVTPQTTITVVPGSVAFPARTVGYTAVTPTTITVNNTGNAVTDALNVSISGRNAASFDLSATTLASIAAGGNGTFTVVPRANLAVGTYSATITVGNSKVNAINVSVTFTVSAASSGNTGGGSGGGSDYSSDSYDDLAWSRGYGGGTRVNTANQNNTVILTPDETPLAALEFEAPYINGYEDGTIRPNGQLTRAELAQIIYNLFGEDKSYRGASYSDVAEDFWGYNAISFAEGNNYMIGYPDGTFMPNAFVTRAELTTAVAKIVKVTGQLGNGKFTDVNGHWAEMQINGLTDNSVINGYEDGTFLPNNHITRTEACVVISRAFNRNYNSYLTEKLFVDLSTDFWGYNYIMNAANGSSN